MNLIFLLLASLVINWTILVDGHIDVQVDRVGQVFNISRALRFAHFSVQVRLLDR